MGDRLDELCRAAGLTREQARRIGDQVIAELRFGAGPTTPRREPPGGVSMVAGLPTRFPEGESWSRARADQDPGDDSDQGIIARGVRSGELERFRVDLEREEAALARDLDHWSHRPPPRPKTGQEQGRRVVKAYLKKKRAEAGVR
jgi:hypothetical protein